MLTHFLHAADIMCVFICHFGSIYSKNTTIMQKKGNNNSYNNKLDPFLAESTPCNAFLGRNN